MSYEHGSFLIESKALAIFDGAESVPILADLKIRTVKHCEKAIRQIRGACRRLVAGVEVTDQSGERISYTNHKAFHGIILVSDLSLLDDAEQFGREFLVQELAENHIHFHFMDLTSLLRSVQHSEIITRRPTAELPLIANFDYALLKRWEIACGEQTPFFDLLWRA